MGFMTRSIVLLVFFVTIATSADIFLEWYVSLGLNDDLVSENKLVEIITFNLLIF